MKQSLAMKYFLVIFIVLFSTLCFISQFSSLLEEEDVHLVQDVPKNKQELANQSFPKSQHEHMPSLENYSIPDSKDDHSTLEEVIHMNLNATLINDILKIVHLPHKQKINIHLKANRKCFKPVLRGRLSGPSLHMLEWTYDYSTNKDQDIINGAYQNVQIGKKYFVEIIALFCNEFTFDLNFTSICLEDPGNNRITMDDAHINTIQSSRNMDSTRKRDSLFGQWISHETNSKPLWTRYQPQNCREKNEQKEPRCADKTSIDRFEPYHFEWHNSEKTLWNERQLKELVQKNSNGTAICALGDSHNRVLVNHWNQIFKTKMQEMESSAKNVSEIKEGIQFHWADAQFPHQVKDIFLYNKVKAKGCNTVIVALGQWTAGWPTGLPTLLPQYKEDMLKVVGNIQTYVPSVQHIILRSVHYIPIGDMVGQCPPTDWRSPHVIDLYNKVLREVAEESNVQYIDTNFIISPLWDSPKDWCHYENEAGASEALYILQNVIDQIR
ncbi:hypothetical protein CTEN210_06498 [Chaetoceros tenuissimus]|uniref:Uncharacterized protein n=1 Tax=Chaetoceros tenuissimus TaxID=426638 RepID=A0AAD3CPY9_9STRA|nr:hypothetical protein CTEN210_06495 [Chaetoceros tenuissimus]GFH50022.1 hypothetical protein CTEN210_06498 [Chaetoceros tenuissimus]